MSQERCLAALLLAAACGVGTAEPAEAVRITAAGQAELSAWEARVAEGLRGGTLRVYSAEEDTLVAGRRHVRYAQLHRGVPVFGGQIALQYQGERPVSAFGFLHDGIDLDVRPTVSGERAVALAEGLTGGRLDPETAPALTVLATDAGYVLAYRLRLVAPGDLIVLFLDAGDGSVALQYSDLQSQSAGTGIGVLNDTKKMSVRARADGVFSAEDQLRPTPILTYDMKGQYVSRSATASDVAVDADNDWRDAAVVDAHTHIGWTYDYLHQRFGRRGLDGRDGVRIRAIVHPVRREDLGLYSPTVVSTYYLNAYNLGGGLLLFGEGLPSGRLDSRGRAWDYTSGALDIVAHEVTHGVTAYSSGLVYLNESGALNESFSDIIGVGAEFFFHEAGEGPRRADYLIWEDTVKPRGVRSFADPCSSGSGCHPDHYSLRYLGPLDNGGIHTNSGISNHAFYLAIEGGTNRTSGLRVQGLGAARRADVEKVFYRAYTSMLTPTADFAMARAATLQSARDLFGAGGDVERAVAAAWSAVGVQ